LLQSRSERTLGQSCPVQACVPTIVLRNFLCGLGAVCASLMITLTIDMTRSLTGLLFSVFAIVCLLHVAQASPLNEVEQRSACTSGVHIVRDLRWLSYNNSQLLQFAVPGHGASNKNGRLQTLINLVKRKIAGSSAQTIRRDGTSEEEEHSRQALTAAIESYAAKCPTTPLMLLGYSFVCLPPI